MTTLIYLSIMSPSISRAAMAFLVAMALVAGASAITCSNVYSTLYPCLGYFQSGGGTAPADVCCSGIKNLLAAAKTGSDRRTTCTCLKQAAAGVSGQNVALASGLPGKCGVKVPYKISPSTDCAKVK